MLDTLLLSYYILTTRSKYSMLDTLLLSYYILTTRSKYSMLDTLLLSFINKSSIDGSWFNLTLVG
jgi:hypothetical protein